MTTLSAEKEGFEPPDLLQSIVFKTTAFDRSAISPVRLIRYNLIAAANIQHFISFKNKNEIILLLFLNIVNKYIYTTNNQML